MGEEFRPDQTDNRNDHHAIEPTGEVGLPMERVWLPGSSTDIAIHVRGGVDRAIVRDVWDRDEYRVRSLTGSQPRVVVDIGAHIGAFALLARALWPAARIVACEADPENARLLRHNLACHEGIEIVEAAIVRDDETHVEFHAVGNKAHSNSGGGSLCRPEPDSEVIRVPALSIARLWESYGLVDCDLLKLDCEGSELPLLEALRNDALNTDSRSTDKIRGEIENILDETHHVNFGARNSGREGRFFADRAHRLVEPRTKSPVASTRDGDLGSPGGER